jgi:aryl-alcohol dehydrogenase-like predicted oxidoreductase
MNPQAKRGAMRAARSAGLIVGSVQLGLAYGAANRTGKPDRQTALRLVRRAADAGVAGFDTARAYGDSEDRLGEALKGRSVPTITKLSPLTEISPKAPHERIIAAVDASIEKSLVALRRDTLDCLLLHRAAQLTQFEGAVWKRLEHHLSEGTVRSLGVSVQSPAEALAALAHPNVRHLQLPFNVFDWRWAEAGVISALRNMPSLTVHARSVFLQGVLTAGDPSIWPRVEGADAPALISWLNECAWKFGRQSVTDLCLAYVRGQDWIDGVVVGMETEEQLESNLSLSTRPPLAFAECAAIDAWRPRVPERLLDPARWPSR